jgi:prepilin-type N-terminal cleavage/methylation domain-containing protein
MKTHNTKGFTLVELLGVVAIIAVLATVSITSISGAIQGARESASKRQIQTLNSAYQNYLAAGGVAAGNSATAVITELTSTVTLPGSTQTVGPFLLSNPGANVLNKAGNNVALNFSASTGFSNAAAL